MWQDFNSFNFQDQFDNLLKIINKRYNMSPEEIDF